MQIIFNMDDRRDGTRETCGFMVSKILGERKCEFDFNFSVFTKQLVSKFLFPNIWKTLREIP